MQYVIIGGGIAGTTAAENLRKLDPKSEITIIEREPYPLYSRILLPFYVKGKIEREKVFLKKQEWYVDNKITFMSGIEATKIDVKNKFVETSEGREIPFDKLLFATGGEPRLADYDLRGVSYFRTLDDADHMVSLIGEMMTLPEKDRHVVIIGGGFIALEYINIFEHLKIDTTVVIRSGGFWSRIMSEHSQKVLLEHTRKKGVKVLLNTPDFELVGTKAVKAVKLADGTQLPAQFVGFGIGVECEHNLYEDAGLECASGLIADKYLMAGSENVYTIGDVAEYDDKILERVLRQPSWLNAQQQARTVAKTMSGEKTVYEQVSSFSASLVGLPIVFVGDTSRKHADEIIEHKATDETSVELFMRKGRLVGAVMIGDVTDRAEITKAITNKSKLQS